MLAVLATPAVLFVPAVLAPPAPGHPPFSSPPAILFSTSRDRPVVPPFRRSSRPLRFRRSGIGRG